MIVTLTVNPSLDRAILLEAPLSPGQVQVARDAREDAGGKGVNVSRVVAAAGAPTRAILPLAADDPYAGLLAAEPFAHTAVPVRGHVRANLTIADPAGETTKLNLPGAALSRADADALVDAVADAAAGADWLVLAGSLPPGAAPDLYVDITAEVRRRLGGDAPRIAVDTSGPALHAVVAHARPDLIKPNEDELAELCGEPPSSVTADILRLSRALVGDRIGAALVTLGAAGAVLVTADGAWHATPPPTRVRSTVGAGDGSLAGYLLADTAGGGAPERLRSAIRYGSAAASLPGTQAPTPADLPTADIPVRSLMDERSATDTPGRSS